MALQPEQSSSIGAMAAAELSRKRWKYVGYRGFCDFVTSDDDFFILRRFSGLTARVLLSLQDELSELEAQLAALEDELSAKDAADVHNGSFRQETSHTRLDIVHTVQNKLREYNELALQHSQLRSRPRVPSKDATSISNWFYNHRNAILAEETDYVNHSKDLFAMVPKSKTPLRKFLERSSHFRLLRLWRKKSVVEDENIHYISDQRINLFVALVITILGLAMLIVPLWILAFVSDSVYRLAVITVFVVVFLCFVSFTTVARPFETLGAAAA